MLPPEMENAIHDWSMLIIQEYESHTAQTNAKIFNSLKYYQ